MWHQGRCGMLKPVELGGRCQRTPTKLDGPQYLLKRPRKRNEADFSAASDKINYRTSDWNLTLNADMLKWS